MLTQKDFYDYLEKNGEQAFDKMADELCKNLNDAKVKYIENQKNKEAQEMVKSLRINSLTDLIEDWFGNEEFSLTPNQMATNIYKAVEEFTAKEKKLMDHATDVKTETKETPDGKITIKTGKIDPKDFESFVEGLIDSLAPLTKPKKDFPF